MLPQKKQFCLVNLSSYFWEQISPQNMAKDIIHFIKQEHTATGASCHNGYNLRKWGFKTNVQLLYVF